MSSSVSRRDFLKIMGATSLVATLVALYGSRPRSLIELQEATKNISSVEIHSVPSICGMCMAQCAIYIDVVDGLPTRIRPNTNAPTSSMGICSRGVSGIYNTLYNPDRLTKPLVRKPLLDWFEGRISWSEALARLRELRGTDKEFVEIDNWWIAAEIIARKLKELADNNERHALVFLYGAWGPIASARLGVPLTRFLDTYGSPNEIQFDSPACVSTRILGHTLTGVHGHQAANPLVDYFHARAIAAARRNTIGAGAVTSAWRFSISVSDGAKLVVFDPVFSETASKADVWVPVKPGTDLVVILAIIRYALEHPEYLDIDYLKRYTNAPHLIVVSRNHRLSGLPIPVSEVDWIFYGLPEDYGKRQGFVVYDPSINKPSPDDLARDYVLEGSYKIRLRDGSEVETKTVFMILKEWVKANLDELAKRVGAGDYLEAVAREADVPLETLMRAIKLILEEKAVFETGWHDPRYSNSPQLWRAIDILMALYGKIQRPGGLFLATHLIAAQSSLYARVKLTKQGDPFYSIRGDSIATYISKYGARLHIVPLVPPLPGPSDRGAPPIPKPLTSEWASVMLREGYPILFPDNQVQALYDSVINGKPYKVKVLMIFVSNPIVQNPNIEVWKKIFRELELVVVHDIMLSDTALYADIVAPDMTYVERLDLPLPGVYSPFPVVSIRFPWYWKLYKDKKIDREIRVFNTRTGFEFILMIAKKLDDLGVRARDGTSFRDNMPIAMLDEEGKIPLPKLEAFINNILRRVVIKDEKGDVRRLTIDDVYSYGGYVILRFTGETTEIVDELWSKALGREVKVRVPIWQPIKYSVEDEKKLWIIFHHNSPVGREVPFPTPTGRIEIYSVELAREIRDVLGRSAMDIDPSDIDGVKSSVDPLFSPIPLYAGKALPDYKWASRVEASPSTRVDGLREPNPSAGELLLVYRHGPFTQTHMTTQNNVLLDKITPDHLFLAWIHPDIASRIGVRDNDWVVIEVATPKVVKQLEAVGIRDPPKMKCRVRVTKMVRSDIIYVLHGWPTESKRERIRLERIRGFRDPEYGVTDDNYFIPIVATQLGGGYAMGTAIVRVRRAG